ncbi:MAG: hypothetical protein H6Q69_2090 [Firmicutes bacterium]|nr:hypothetical protein [Bacillota bacterium]
MLHFIKKCVINTYFFSCYALSTASAPAVFILTLGTLPEQLFLAKRKSAKKRESNTIYRDTVSVSSLIREK